MYLKSLGERAYQTVCQDETHKSPGIFLGDREGQELLPTGKPTSQGKGEDCPV